MRVLLTGATGFIGRALVARLRRDGHAGVAWVRSPDRARAALGADVDLVPAAGPDAPAALVRALGGADAVVNLAGEGIGDARWTDARKRLLRTSRIDVTTALVAAMAEAEPKPRVLVSASGVGYYGDRQGEAAAEEIDESSGAGDDFLARLCVEWEAAARAAEGFGTRVVLLRTGFVVGRGGGALPKMLTPFKLGVGGPIASGRQFMPWIHLDDAVAMIVAALTDEGVTGPINLVGPTPVTNRDFVHALGRALGRPAIMPVPALALRALYGEMSFLLLSGQRALPRKMQSRGFVFAHTDLEEALRISTR